MQEIPSEVAVLVKKARSVEWDQRYCYHDIEWVPGTIRPAALYDHPGIAPENREHRLQPQGHWHCLECNMRSARKEDFDR